MSLHYVEWKMELFPKVERALLKTMDRIEKDREGAFCSEETDDIHHCLEALDMMGCIYERMHRMMPDLKSKYPNLCFKAA